MALGLVTKGHFACSAKAKVPHKLMRGTFVL